MDAGKVAALLRELARLFWDTRPEGLDLEAHRTFIIERVLDYGGEEAIDWVQTTYSPEQLTDVVRHSRRLFRKTANYWAIRLGINPAEVRVLREPSPFWPY